ncbi:ribonuclease P protein component 2 [archaeon]|nr:ribonuclease P protein component 2 [archaeon]|tara:strand:+ start:228 stop:617 length:390 start_codon:yes stop_codon:yes gene_type:complete
MENEDKPKTLPPSLRQPKRYVVFELIGESPIEYGSVVNAIWLKLFELYGEFGTSEMDMWIIENLFRMEKQRGIIKCSHKEVEKMRTALTLINIISEIKVIVNVLGVTGTIKSAEKKYFGVTDITTFAKP